MKIQELLPLEVYPFTLNEIFLPDEQILTLYNNGIIMPELLKLKV